MRNAATALARNDKRRPSSWCRVDHLDMRGTLRIGTAPKEPLVKIAAGTGTSA
jgi:hypothetical protein